MVPNVLPLVAMITIAPTKKILTQKTVYGEVGKTLALSVCAMNKIEDEEICGTCHYPIEACICEPDDFSGGSLGNEDR